MLSIMPYTVLAMRKTNNKLNTILKESGDQAELGEAEKKSVADDLKKWVNLHRGRVALALGSAVVFFVAKQYTKIS